MSDLEKVLARTELLLARIEAMLPAPPRPVDWRGGIAFRWRKSGGRGFLQPVSHPHHIRLSDLRGIDRQKDMIEANTRQFVEGRTANNVLLTGARGTGKSSLIKAALNRFAKQGMRLIEVDKHDLVDLADIVDLVSPRSERFVIYCDDLSFEAAEPGYKALKVVLDGSIATASENLLVYATSNRRHLMPEFMQENLEYKNVGEEIHPGETSEEKVSLSDRFGLWLSFYPFDQDAYLDIVSHWLRELGAAERDLPAAHRAALQWSLSRGSRSGRVAWQFARDWVGRRAGAAPARKKR
jgi:predicted AAA+ superfamily ATPase